MSGGKELRALSGIAAGAVGVGVAQPMAVPFGLAADSLSTVGSAVIDLTPGGVKEWAIHTLGGNRQRGGVRPQTRTPRSRNVPARTRRDPSRRTWRGWLTADAVATAGGQRGPYQRTSKGSRPAVRHWLT
jgi:hypothetical protein